MPPTTSRAAATRDALLSAALQEFAAFGVQRSSMESLARRAGVSRATLYLRFENKEAVLRALVERLHDEQVAAMDAVLVDGSGRFEERLLAMLEARFVRFVELTSASPHAAELYDLHHRVCGDIAADSQARSERLLVGLLGRAAQDGEIDLNRTGLTVVRLAEVVFDCARGAKGENPSRTTPAEFRERLARTVRVLTLGLAPTD